MPGTGRGSTGVVPCWGREGPAVPEGLTVRSEAREPPQGARPASALHLQGFAGAQPVAFLPEALASCPQEPALRSPRHRSA